MSSPAQTARNRLGGKIRRKAPPEEIAELRAALAAAKAAALPDDVLAAIIEANDDAPPLTDAQRSALRFALHQAAGNASTT